MTLSTRQLLTLKSGYKPRSKFRNIPTEVDGVRFASRAEARRYGELKLLERAGEILQLEMQPKYELMVNGIRVGRYTGDFRYVEKGATVVEDVKSKASKTEAYGVRKRLMLAVHGIEIRELA